VRTLDTLHHLHSVCIIVNVILIIDMVFVVDVEHSHVRFLGNLVLNLWDCGG